MTVFDEAARQLRAVCEAVDQHVLHDSVQFCDGSRRGVGDDMIERIPRWSCLGDDCSPFEVSLAMRAAQVTRFGSSSKRKPIQHPLSPIGEPATS